MAAAYGANMLQTRLKVFVGLNMAGASVKTPSLIYCKSSRSLT